MIPISASKIAKIIIGLGMLSCASMPRPLPTDPPQSTARLGQSENPSEAKVVASGVGYKREDAVADAYKSSLKIVVDQLLAKSPDENRAFAAQAGAYYAKAKTYTRQGRVISQIIDEENKYQVEMQLVFNVQQLRSDLENGGIIKSQSEIAETASNPSLCVLPGDGLKMKAWSGAVVAEAESYFTTQGYNVENLAHNQRLNVMSRAIQNVSGAQRDDVLDIAQQLGCDVYVVVDATIDSGRSGSDTTYQAVANVSIFETTTGANKGSGTGRTGERVSANPGIVASDAVKDAVRYAQAQLMKYWATELKKGHQFRVTVTADQFSHDASDILNDILKQISTNVRVIHETNQTLEIQLWTKHDDARSIMREMQSRIQQAGKGTLEGTATRKMINLQYTE